MSEQDVDDVAFLTGSDTGLHRDGRQDRNYEHDGFIIVCSRKKSFFLFLLCLVTVLSVALIIAFARPVIACPCDETISDHIEDANASEKAELISTTGEVFPWNNIRLPTFAHPIRYNISIHPNLTSTKVRGHVTIELFIEENTKYIVFHSSGLTINEKIVQETRKQNVKQKIAKLLEYPKRQQMYLELDGIFRKKTNYTIHLKYSSKLSDELEGFYLSSYTTPNGETKYVAATHFEPTFARTAFPCFDEPQYKARFKISIYRDRFHIALCNMPVENTEEAGFFLGSSILRDDFQESVDMSTYLVAFVVCDFVRTTSETKKNIHVYVPRHLLPQTMYASKIAAEIMEYYESFFGIPYPLPKQDLIALPNFGSGAMENWGLITFREATILHDPKETSVEIKESIAVVIAHEMAHQWFGNLVTMKWWNDVWLNEGAATFFEYKGVNHISPEWDIMDMFIVYKTQPALRLDALANSHPISVLVENPSDIESIFDNISYNKGSAILYMLEGFLGEDIFKKGLNEYLNTHAYGNADTSDLWAAFTKCAQNKYDVRAIMDTWTQQMGFPLIIITKEEDNVIRLSQRRFLMSVKKNGTDILKPKSPFDYKWYVPVTYYTDKEPHEIRHAWLNMTHVDISGLSASEVKYIKCNVNQTGFYRVNYTEEMWLEIIKILRNNHTAFSAADRANLIDDAFTLNEAGMLHIRIPLQLSLYLEKERDYVPWETAQVFLISWRKRLSEHAAYKKFTEFVRKLLKPVVKYVGWNDDGSHLKKMLRSSVIKTALVLGMEDILTSAKSLFHEWLEKGTPIAPNIRNIVYEIGIRYGDENTWFHCWNIYQNTKISSEKQVILHALGATADLWLLQRYLLFSLDQKLIRTQDISNVIWAVASNENGRYLAWRHMKAYWPQIQTLFGNATYSMIPLISDVIPNFYTEYDYREISEFFKQIDLGSSTRTLEQSLEMIQFNIQWVKENGIFVDEWLNNFNSSLSGTVTEKQMAQM